MSICYEYLSDFERSMMVETETIKNEFDKLQTLYEMTCLQITQIDKEIEHKVFSESGTYDDFSYLLMEADEEAVTKKKGIIQSIIDAIIKFFQRLTGKSEKIKNANVKPETMVSVPADLEQKSATITGAMGKMQTGITKLQTGDFTGALDIITGAAAPIAVVAIGANVAYKQITKSKCDEICNDMDKAQGFFNGVWEKVRSIIPGLKDSKTVDDANACVKKSQSIGQAIDSILNAINSGIQQITGKAAEDDAQKAAEDKAKIAAQNEERSRKAAFNNVLEKPDKTGGKYVIDRTTGEIKYFDKNGNEIQNIDKSSIPQNIIQAAQHARGKAAVAARDAKQKSYEKLWVDRKKLESRTFTPDQVGAKVFIDGNSGNVTINGKTVTEPLDHSVDVGKVQKILKKYGVKKNHGAIYDAIWKIKQGIIEANEEQGEIDKHRAKIERQNRVTNESVCDLMNEVLEDTVLEAVIDNDCIALIEHSINPEIISEEIILSLENEGYTVVINDECYEIYE